MGGMNMDKKLIKVRILEKNGDLKHELNFWMQQRNEETLLLNIDTGVWKIDPKYNQLFEETLDTKKMDVFVDTSLFRKLQEDDLLEIAVDDNRDNAFRLLILETSERCNMRCKYCFEDAKTRGANMNTDTAIKAFKKFISLEACGDSICIEFNGGEALLNFEMIKKVVPQMVEGAKSAGKKIKFTIQTNGTLLTREMASFFKKYEFAVGISIDGVGTYNDNRVYCNGAGTFDDIVKGIKLLKEYGIPYSTISVMYELGQYDSIVELLKYTGCKEFRANLITTIGRGENVLDINNGEFKAKEMAREYVIFIKRMLQEKRYYEANTIYYFLGLLLWHPFMCYKEPCGAGVNQLFITSNGDVFLCQECCFIGQGKVGNVNDEKMDLVEEIQNNDWFQKSQGRITSEIEECIDCPWKRFCCTCPCKVYAECRQIEKKSIFCEFNKYLFEELIWLIHNDTEVVMDFLQYNF
ncbi:MAG: radical SAM protein [Lachnospiraceae bacterium]|nr:radical SAM protein [Lachnospiraceae bacterium]